MGKGGKGKSLAVFYRAWGLQPQASFFWCRTGALACPGQPGAAVLHFFLPTNRESRGFQLLFPKRVVPGRSPASPGHEAAS